MDQKRLITAIAVSVAILLIFQLLVAPHLPHPPAPPPHVASQTTPAQGGTTPLEGSPGTAVAATASHPSVPANVPRVKIAAPRLRGSISRLGARIDDLILTDYRETQDPNSPQVRLF